MTNIEHKIEQNKALVHFCLNKYFASLINDEDAKQSGLIGLWKAVKTFDSNRGTVFSTYAVHCIYNEILMYCRFLAKNDKLNPISINALYENNNGNSYELLDVLGTYDFDFTDCETKQFVSILNVQEKKAIILKMQGKTQVEIAKVIGTSQAWVSRLFKNIASKLQQAEQRVG